jgi:predicted transcriptional regulator
MNNRERGERIRLQILRDVKHHPNDISRHIGSIFSISPQAVNSHIRRALVGFGLALLFGGVAATVA